MKDRTGVYLHPAENNPKPPRAQNKRFITKYIFIAAVSQRRKICNGIWFDGEIGIWPIVDIGQAKRDSKNRKMATPIMKLAAVHGERYELMIGEAIPVPRRECQDHQVTRSLCSKMGQSRTR
ncbi:unnamed protein product [Discosporangium mesarthrocarpum]